MILFQETKILRSLGFRENTGIRLKRPIALNLICILHFIMFSLFAPNLTLQQVLFF